MVTAGSQTPGGAKPITVEAANANPPMVAATRADASAWPVRSHAESVTIHDVSVENGQAGPSALPAAAAR